MTDDATYRAAIQRATLAERERDELKSSLRDHFAGLAMGGLLLDDNGDFSDPAWMAEQAYKFADAMLAARKAQS